MQDECSPNTGPTCDGGTTCGPFRQNPLPIGDATSSAEDSLARISAQPEEGTDWRESVPVCGITTAVLLATYDHATSLWRTLQLSLLPSESEEESSLRPPSVEFSGTWPRSGMMRSGRAFRLAPLVPRISGTEFSFLPTPMSAERRSYQRDRGQKGSERLTLLGHARLHHFGILPTPMATDIKGSPGVEKTIERSRHPKRCGSAGVRLPEAIVRILATPNAGDWKAGYCDSETRRQQSLPRDVARLLGLIAGKRGRLNPEKTGWMMGFPEKWLKPVRDLLETPSCHKSPSGSESES